MNYLQQFIQHDRLQNAREKENRNEGSQSTVTISRSIGTKKTRRLMIVHCRISLDVTRHIPKVSSTIFFSYRSIPGRNLQSGGKVGVNWGWVDIGWLAQIDVTFYCHRGGRPRTSLCGYLLPYDTCESEISGSTNLRQLVWPSAWLLLIGYIALSTLIKINNIIVILHCAGIYAQNCLMQNIYL